ncbi:MAG: hypothetical protein RIR48_3263, partial [Bacteroidota bacterium]
LGFFRGRGIISISDIWDELGMGVSHCCAYPAMVGGIGELIEVRGCTNKLVMHNRNTQ